MWRLAITHMTSNRRRLVRTCSAVLLGVAFLAGTLVLGDTMRAGFGTAFANAFAGTDVVVRGDSTVGSDTSRQVLVISPSTLDDIRDVDGVAAAVGIITGSAQVNGADGAPIGGDGPPTLGENWVDDPSSPYTLAEGRAPERDGEIVVDRATARSGDLSVGDVTTVRTPQLIEATVVGIAVFGAQDTIGGSGYTAFTESDARRLLLGGDPGWTGISVRSDGSLTDEQLRDAVAAVLPQGVEAMTGEQAAAQAEEEIGADFLDAFEMFLLAFTAVALLVSAFSIYNTFSVILAQRTRESAMLRAIGATRGQVLGSIAIESVVIGALAAVGGVLAGIGLAVGLRSLLAQVGVDLPGGIQVEVASVVAAALVGLVVTLLASVGPAMRAARVAPLAALRESAVDRSEASRVRTVAGVAITVGGIGLVFWAALGLPSAALAIVGYGSVLSVIGLIVLGPVVARPVALLLGWPLQLGRGATGVLARGNAMRNPRRTASTASALMIGVAVVALFTVVGSSLSAMVRQAVVGTVHADLLIVDSSFSGSAMSPELAPTIDGLDGVESAVGLGYGAALVDGEEQEFTVSDPALLAAALDTGEVEGSMRGLAPDEVAVARSLAEERGWQLGTPIELTFIDGATETMRVGSIYTEVQLAGWMVMPRAAWSPHATSDLDVVVAITLDDGVDAALAAERIDEVAGGLGAPGVQTLDEYADEVAGEINQLLGIVYVLLALSIVIALMGIANTLALSIHERTRELGLLRAIGQTRRQLRSMVRREAVIIASFGTLGGIGLGLFLAWGLVRSMASLDLGLTAFSAPVGQLVVIALLGALAGVLAAWRPARRAARMDVLDAISTE
jgi:putative ABC transport system permease protein